MNKNKSSRFNLMTTIVTISGLFAIGGCSTFGPPIKSTHGGAPGQLRPLHIRGGATVFGSGSIDLGIPLTKEIVLEVGNDFRLHEDSEGWAIGSVGLKYRAFGKPEERWFALDVELGVGGGVGGSDSHEDSENKDNFYWAHNFAGGGYFGVGLGFHLKDWFALFWRGRGQVVWSEQIPVTLWGSTIAGAEITYRIFSIYLAGGIAGYHNTTDAQGGGIAEVGVTFRF